MFKLKRLEITGFKSFADYTDLVFTGEGITAIVGPNGCGKSNVADAIAWVLGEQRVKQLRGAAMMDVIFQGSRNRAPSGMAEVVLHLVRDETMAGDVDADIDDIDSTLEEIDEHSEAVEEGRKVEGEIADEKSGSGGRQRHEVEAGVEDFAHRGFGRVEGAEEVTLRIFPPQSEARLARKFAREPPLR